MLEITESVLVQDAEAVIARMLELKDLGVAFAIDDFGTGYSSLSYLKRFPIDILKVDKSFVDDVGDSVKSGVLAEADRPAREHAASSRRSPRASSSEHQVDGLRALGCQFGQGFHFAKPLRVEQVDELLSKMSAGDLSPEVVAMIAEPVP